MTSMAWHNLEKVNHFRLFLEGDGRRSRACIWGSGFLQGYPREWYLSHLIQGIKGELAADRKQREQEIA